MWEGSAYCPGVFSFITFVIIGTLYVGFRRVQGFPVSCQQAIHQFSLVKTTYPGRQFIHVECTGNPIAALVIIPVSSIGSVTSRQNSATILYSNSNYFTPEICCQPKFIRYSCYKQAIGAHFPGF